MGMAILMGFPRTSGRRLIYIGPTFCTRVTHHSAEARHGTAKTSQDGIAMSLTSLNHFMEESLAMSFRSSVSRLGNIVVLANRRKE